jgi:hypothetical protein
MSTSKEVKYCFLEIEKNKQPDFVSAHKHINTLTKEDEELVLWYVEQKRKEITSLQKSYDLVIKMWAGLSANTSILSGEETDTLVTTDTYGNEFDALYVFIACGAAYEAGFYAEDWDTLKKHIKIAKDYV